MPNSFRLRLDLRFSSILALSWLHSKLDLYCSYTPVLWCNFFFVITLSLLQSLSWLTFFIFYWERPETLLTCLFVFTPAVTLSSILRLNHPVIFKLPHASLLFFLLLLPLYIQRYLSNMIFHLTKSALLFCLCFYAYIVPIFNFTSAFFQLMLQGALSHC